MERPWLNPLPKIEKELELMKLCNEVVETHKSIDNTMSKQIVFTAQNILYSYLTKIDMLASYVKPNDPTIDE